jgi:hypothetical protein
MAEDSREASTIESYQHTPDYYQSELLQMAEEDQNERNIMMKDESFDTLTLDQRNTQRMKQIVSKIGWPTRSLVGEKASNETWLLLQHADHDIGFQKQCLQMLKVLQEGEVKKEEIALLEDRVRVNKAEPQLYGTQGLPDEQGRFVPFPIDDPEGLEQRRQEMGMISFSVHKEARTYID